MAKPKPRGKEFLVNAFDGKAVRCVQGSAAGALSEKDSSSKTVAILTRHNFRNYGSVLQAYATERALRSLGCAPITIDYRRDEETLEGWVRRFSKGRGPLHKLYRRSVWLLLTKKGESVFRAERERLLTLSRPCGEGDIWEKLPPADVYLTGSDQVWTAIGPNSVVDGVYFWEGIEKSPGQRMVSYAASFGTGELAPGYEGKIARWLSRYDAISTREDSGVALAAQCGCEATQVLDPTLLLAPGDWEAFAREGRGRVPARPYALVYKIHRDTDMLPSVKRDVGGSDLEVVSLCPTFRPRMGRHIILPTTAEFAALFQGASRVYTDSFHGCVFSILFKVPFAVFPPVRGSERIYSLLRLLGLEDRLWRAETQDRWSGDIDWEAVHGRIGSERARSLAWLKAALGLDQ